MGKRQKWSVRSQFGNMTSSQRRIDVKKLDWQMSVKITLFQHSTMTELRRGRIYDAMSSQCLTNVKKFSRQMRGKMTLV